MSYKKEQLNAYRVYLILSFFSQLLFSLIFTVNLLYHVSVARLSPLELVLVGTILETSIFIFEIPTGIVADKKSRKLSIVIGYSLIGVGFIIEGLFPFFISIAIAQVIWGVGYTFTSGATQAWIADEVGEEKASKAFLKGAQLGQYGELIAIPFSMFIGYISLNLPILVGGVLMLLLSLFLVIAMKENGFRPVDTHGENKFKIIKNSIADIKKISKAQQFILYLLGIGLFYGLYSEGFDRLWTAHIINDFNITLVLNINAVVLVGIIRVISLLLNIVVMEIIYKKMDLCAMNKVIRILFFSTLAIVFCLAGFGLINNIWVVIALFWVIGVMRSISSPLMDTWLNAQINDSSIRSTMFSVKGQVDSLGQIGGGPLVGLIGNIFSIRAALFLCSVLLLPVILLFQIVRKKSKTQQIVKINTDY